MKSVVLLAALTATAFAGGAKKVPPKPPAPPAAAEEPAAKPFPGPTDHRRIVAVLDVRVDGAPTEVGAQFQRDLEAGVDSDKYFLAARTRVHDRMTNSTKWTEGCVIGGCLREVKTQTGADIVLLAALNGSGTSYGWVITLVGTNTGAVISQQSERCDVCTISEALNTATATTIKLLNNIPAVLEGEAPKPLPPPPPVEAKHSRTLGTALSIAGGAVAIAGAAYYFSQNSNKNGLVVAAGGGGLLVGGLLTLAF